MSLGFCLSLTLSEIWLDHLLLKFLLSLPHPAVWISWGLSLHPAEVFCFDLHLEAGGAGGRQSSQIPLAIHLGVQCHGHDPTQHPDGGGHHAFLYEDMLIATGSLNN